MKLVTPTTTLLAVTLLAAVAAGQGEADPPDPPDQPRKYVCPPCPVDCHDTLYDRPGTCHGCGMTLVERSTVPDVVILLYEGVDLLSFTGPAGVFHGSGTSFVFPVADTADPLRSEALLTVTPRETLAEAPAADVLVVPGGSGVRDVMDDAMIIDWIRTQAREASHVLAIGSGFVLLAKAGLLDDAKVAVHPRAARWYRELTPDVTFDTEAPLTRSGRVTTARDPAAGVQAALNIVSEMAGAEKAAAIAERLGFQWTAEAGAAAEGP